MPFSFKFLAMTAIATLLFQATTASLQQSLYYCGEGVTDGLYPPGSPDDGLYYYYSALAGGVPPADGYYTDATELEATMTTEHCLNNQSFRFDSTNPSNCDCGHPKCAADDGFDKTAPEGMATKACGTGMTGDITRACDPQARGQGAWQDEDDSNCQSVVDCDLSQPVYDNEQRECKVNTTATCGTGTVYDNDLKQCKVNTTATCGTGTVYDNALKQCKVDTTAICGEGTSFDQSKSVCARTCISTKERGLRKVTILNP